MNKFEEIDYFDKAIDFSDMFSALYKRKVSIAISTISAGILSIFFALSLPNIYKSTSTLAPSSTNESLGGQMSSLSPVASLVGVNLPVGEIPKTYEAIERIKSFEFFSNHFLPYIKLENLIAVDKWVPISNTIIYDNKLYDESKKEWVRNVSYPRKKIPSNQEAFREYERILDIQIDKNTAFVEVSIIHKSPVVSKNWLDIIIKNINESMRSIDIDNAKNSIDYLNEYYKSTNVQSLRQSISNLQESQMQKLMLASSNSDYIFKILDAPYIPERRFSPNRSLICVVLTFLGFIISILYILVVHYSRRN
tara:strand:- start:575 stop:1498 length:924 start_codon:yes stop_codon:yes gene_type:complete